VVEGDAAMISLAHRVITMPPYMDEDFIKKLSTAYSLNEATAAVMFCRKTIPLSHHIRLDNVAAFIRSQENIKWRKLKDIPNWAPPFMSIWAEWMDLETQVGMLVTYNIIDKNNSPPPEWLLNECPQKPLQEILPYWKMDAFRWISKFGKNSDTDLQGMNIGGVPIYCGEGTLGVHKSGMVTAFRNDSIDTHNNNEYLLPTLLVYGLGISFMHCKNVRQIEHKDDPGERFRKQYKVKKITYKTLVIDPMKEVLRTEGQSESLGLGRALHICRGHFSHYSEEKPLFGKYSGSFWIPDHVRGKKEHGEVVKDYSVKAPMPDQSQQIEQRPEQQ
jgi:hypothetical protein